MGVWTKQTLPQGLIIGAYKGKICTDRAAEKKPTYTNYFYEVTIFGFVLCVIDGACKRSSSYLRYVNAPGQYCSKEMNCVFARIGLSIYLVADEEIKEGTELIAGYGRSQDRLITQGTHGKAAELIQHTYEQANIHTNVWAHMCLASLLAICLNYLDLESFLIQLSKACCYTCIGFIGLVMFNKKQYYWALVCILVSTLIPTVYASSDLMPMSVRTLLKSSSHSYGAWISLDSIPSNHS